MDSTFSLPPQVITHDTTYFKLLDAQFASRALATGAKHLRGSRWPTHAVFPADAPEVIATAYYEAQHSFEALLDLDGAIAQLVRRGDGAVLRVAAKNEESLERAEAELRRRLPEPTGHQAVNVDFWHWEDDRSTWTSRSIPVPSLSEVEGNYTRAADAELRWLVDEFRPDSAGRLVLWHGPPGCGKTWALRALAWEWRDWCAVKYVIDPEVFLNEPGYMVRLLHQRASGQQTGVYGEFVRKTGLRALCLGPRPRPQSSRRIERPPVGGSAEFARWRHPGGPEGPVAGRQPGTMQSLPTPATDAALQPRRRADPLLLARPTSEIASTRPGR